MALNDHEILQSYLLQDAIENLYNDTLAPWDREVLVDSPLPNDVMDPFFTQNTNTRDLMNITFFSLSGWINDAKKTSYFSERFVSLSKLIHKGVMTMGRGLVTLHNRGEDLSDVPMQIGDLIAAASYQFRKSYLGVLQTTRRNPELSEKLLVNQLNWTNLLLRLFKTQEKLEKPVCSKDQKAIEEPTAQKTEALPGDAGIIANSLPKGFDPDSVEPLEGFSESETSSLGGASSISGFSAFAPASAIAPARALSSLDRAPRRKKTGGAGKVKIVP